MKTIDERWKTKTNRRQIDTANSRCKTRQRSVNVNDPIPLANGIVTDWSGMSHTKTSRCLQERLISLVAVLIALVTGPFEYIHIYIYGAENNVLCIRLSGKK